MLGAIGAANILRRWGFSLRPRARGKRGHTSGQGGSSSALGAGVNSSGQQLEVQTKCGKCTFIRQQHKQTTSTAQCSHDFHQSSGGDHSSIELYTGPQNIQLECLNDRRKRKAAQLKLKRQQEQNDDNLDDLETGFKIIKFCPHKRRKRKKEDKDGASIARSGSCSLSNHSIHRYLYCCCCVSIFPFIFLFYYLSPFYFSFF